ncbi:MAG: hypothetical protein IK097_04000 [Clostridia bacterium]|nr:hypothetical protein [Clostridia bacterium]
MSKTDKVIMNSAMGVSEKVLELEKEFISRSADLKEKLIENNTLLAENNRLLGEILRKLEDK